MTHVEEFQWGWVGRALPETRWSLLERITKRSESSATLSAEEFCRVYWHPLYAYLRSDGFPPADAQDYVQSFMKRLWEENWLERADPAKGRFRHFLLTLLVRHTKDCRRRERAVKRGGRAIHVPLTSQEAEAAYLRDSRGAASPEDCFRRALAIRLVDESLKALRERYVQAGDGALWEALLPALEGPVPGETFEKKAALLGMRPTAVRMAALRLRERFRQQVRVRAGALFRLPLGAALDQEIRDLFTET